MNHLIHPQNSSPRLNSRGGSPYPSHPTRGTHNYHNAHPQHHQQPYSHPQMPVHSPHPLNPIHSPYPQHLKYPQPYASTFPYSTPSPTIYPPSWQNPQPISPLPKQLSMSAGGVSPAYHEASPTLSPKPNTNGSLLQHNSPTPVISSPPSEPVQLSSYTHTGTITTSETGASSDPSDPAISLPQPPAALNNPTSSWAIWSRRPQNPSHAPGVIISPRARPPPDIVQQALELATPPASPPPAPVAKVPIESTTNEAIGTSNIGASVSLCETEIHSPPIDLSRDQSTVPSSAVTEATEAPTVPGSPISTNTSVSLDGAPPKDNLPDNSTSAPPPLLPTPSSDAEVAVPPTPAAPVKKSWASLLRPPPSSAASGAAPVHTKNTLPTSSVVGVSIPAASKVTVSPSKKSELLSLLTTGPTGGSTSISNTVNNIRPRGLINTGNMCFANSVLQVLVYCQPFHKLFVELGKTPLSGVTGEPASTPLVDATIAFLQEFTGEEKTKKEKLTNGGAGGSGGRGKGKDREIISDDDDWDGESFIPTNIYDAMKEKKRFDNMRGGHQEDAEEFLGFYLDTLEEELLSVINSILPPTEDKLPPAAVEEREEAAPPIDDGWQEVGRRNKTVVTRTIKATESPITRIFGGKFRSTLRAPHQKDSVIVEDWRSLRLDIQRDQIHTIQDALTYISHPQPVQMTNPAKPGIIIEASQQILIESLPAILVLHIKRFCYDTAVGGVVKVGKQVRFGPELEIGPDVMTSVAKKTIPTRYKLFGALYHHGLSASGGHYTLDILHPCRYPNHQPNSKPREGWYG
ncbi:hypothetical protein BD779DRAFT_754219 [Infundibulicybe gibba]|nr:hypothetical protein BD779DRAFT_754219 [Infundibulicybe gibba]